MNVLLDYDKVNIDKYCVNSILLLNAKGYLTKDCCSGHIKKERSQYSGNMPYIGFLEDYIPPNFPSFIREVCTYGENNDRKGIYFELPTNPTKKDIQLLWSNIEHWVLSLSYNAKYLLENS